MSEEVLTVPILLSENLLLFHLLIRETLILLFSSHMNIRSRWTFIYPWDHVPLLKQQGRNHGIFIGETKPI